MRHTRLGWTLAVFASALAPRPAAGGPTAGETVRLTAPDGVALAATYYAAGGPGPAILLLHQCNKDRGSWQGLAPRLAARGFHVLTLDYRGYGQSGGTPYTELNFAEQARISAESWPGDVDAALAHLSSRPGVRADAIGAAGASCGVNQSIQLSRRHPEVRSLALLSGNTDRAGRLHLEGRSGLPLLLAAADDDGGIVEIMAWIDATSGSPANRFLRYPTGGHGTDMFRARPELPDRIVAWFEATLLGRGSPPAAVGDKPGPTVQLLTWLDEPGGPARVAERLAAERKVGAASALLEPGFVNRVGYEALQAGDTRAAVAIMRVATEVQPQSSNAWDSLADACLADGQLERAREYSEKALRLVEGDASEPEGRKELIRQSARDKLARLAGAAPKH
jgi:dienelactone hydrolase